MDISKRFDLPGRTIVTAVAVAVILLTAAWVFVEWSINRIYVPVGSSLKLQYKGPPLPFLPHSGQAPEPDEIARSSGDPSTSRLGVLRELRGPGRHFYSPLWWEREIVEDVIIEPGQVAIVTSKVGDNLPPGQIVVDGAIGTTTFKGPLRNAVGPGRYRVNPYLYEFKVRELETIGTGTQKKYAGWVEIRPGYVGVVTNQTSNPITKAPAGLQPDVLPPGIYPINARDQRIDIVNIGYREISLTAELKRGPDGNPIRDASGEPVLDDNTSGITFPSNDGFPINMDFTAIWGIMPDQATAVIDKFGDVDAVEDKVVIPQIKSICRNEGSSRGAVELLVGDTRQAFQEDTSETFRTVLEEKNITLLYGLVRHIYIPQDVRLPIQQGYVAEELKLTRQQEQVTAETEAELRQEERKVELESERVMQDTEKLVAKVIAEGNKQAAETRAEITKEVAAIDREIAELEAQATIVLGEATSDAQKMLAEARAEKFRLAVDAFGSGDAYNQWVFAEGLPQDMQLDLFYAGEGTFWTDLKGFSETMLGRQMQQQNRPRSSRETSTPPMLRRPSGR